MRVLEEKTAVYCNNDSEPSEISILMDKLKSEIERVLLKLSQPQAAEAEVDEKNLQDDLQAKKPIQQLVPKFQTKEEDEEMADEAGDSEVKEAAPVDVTVSEEIKDE